MRRLDGPNLEAGGQARVGVCKLADEDPMVAYDVGATMGLVWNAFDLPASAAQSRRINC